jgi:hypothetical protein
MACQTLHDYGNRESAIPSLLDLTRDSVAFSLPGLARYHRHHGLTCYGASTSGLVSPFPSLDQRNSWPSSLPLTVEKGTDMMTPAPRFANDDEAAQYWLGRLRDGTNDQKIEAREQLATIFERRGMFEEATDLLVSNLRAGVRNADIFRRLARLYRAQGDEVTAMQAAVEAAKLMPSGSPKPTKVAPPQKSSLGRLAVVGVILVVALSVTGAVSLVGFPSSNRGIGVTTPAIGPENSPPAGMSGSGNVVGSPIPGNPSAPDVVALTSVSSLRACPQIEDRFPQWRDPVTAVRASTSYLRTSPHAGTARFPNPGVAQHYETAFRDLPAHEAVAGYIINSFLATRNGLSEHALFRDFDGYLMLHIMAHAGREPGSAYKLRPTASPVEFDALLKLPDSDCDGLVLRTPASESLRRYALATVGATGWADSLP